jgi:hypothetical protein
MNKEPKETHGDEQERFDNEEGKGSNAITLKGFNHSVFIIAILCTAIKVRKQKGPPLVAPMKRSCDGTSPFFQKGTPAVNLSHHAEKAAPGNPRGSIPTPESADRFNSDPC